MTRTIRTIVACAWLTALLAAVLAARVVSEVLEVDQ